MFRGCFWGALDDFFLASSSRDMTATVLSNAALEKKATSAQGFTTLWWGARAHANWAI